jgi:hypothetical protein
MLICRSITVQCAAAAAEVVRFGSRGEECEVTVPRFHNPKVKKEPTVRAAQLFLLAALFFTSLETASAQAPAKPAELKVLDRLDGKWRYEWESKPTGGDPKESKGSGTSTNEWILDGWFQQRKCPPSRISCHFSRLIL